jgi:hypothetical protein
MTGLFLENIIRVLITDSTWQGVLSTIFQYKKANILPISENSNTNNNSLTLPVQTSLVEESIWKGTLQYESESLDVKLTLSDSNGNLSGFLDVVDPVNSNLVRMGNITTGSRVNEFVTIETDSNLQITASVTANSFVGKGIFPGVNGEGQGLQADINLSLEGADENNKIYLPIVIR